MIKSPGLNKKNARHLAFIALKSVHKDAFTDVALDQVLSHSDLNHLDRGLVTELVYGSVRRMRTLDAIIDQIAQKKSANQPPDLRTLLHLGLYQLRYLNIPESAAVNTTVELAKISGFSGLSGVVNGILRQYIRLKALNPDPLILPDNPIQKLGILHSFPDWIIELWLGQFGFDKTEQICQWMNQTPSIDLRVNILKSSLKSLEDLMLKNSISVNRVHHLPQCLRLTENAGAIYHLPGFKEGLFVVQDSSAQLVTHLLAPQPGEIIIDSCAAPGGKTTHIVELIGDNGTVWGCDRTESRLKKLKQNAQRLQLNSIKFHIGDSRNLPQFTNMAHRVLLDVPCSGNGTLHRHPDARWRQNLNTVKELCQLQRELLIHGATWVKNHGFLVYATCTLNPQENEDIINDFLAHNPDWQIVNLAENDPLKMFQNQDGLMKILPNEYNMDGFFMVKLQLTINNGEV